MPFITGPRYLLALLLPARTLLCTDAKTTEINLIYTHKFNLQTNSSSQSTAIQVLTYDELDEICGCQVNIHYRQTHTSIGLWLEILDFLKYFHRHQLTYKSSTTRNSRLPAIVNLNFIHFYMMVFKFSFFSAVHLRSARQLFLHVIPHT